MLELIDTHCHLDFPDFDADRDAILQRCYAAGIRTLVIPAVSIAYLPRVRAMAQHAAALAASPVLLPAFGLHPVYLSEHRAEHLEQLAQWVAQCAPVAVGEIGLDFFIDNADEHAQIDLFKAQLLIAKRHALPVLLHVRKAHDQVLKCLRETGFVDGGIVHAYSGSKSQAERYLAQGFCLGIGGGATYDRAQRLHRLLRELPLTSFVLETDAPDIPPSFARQQRNSPDFLLRIAECIAELSGVPLTDLLVNTTHAARRVLRIDLPQ